ncbi:MAG: hypothetical protein ACRETF_06010 [Nevskiaceae bacterium]
MEEAKPDLLTGVADFAAKATQMVSAAHMEVALLSQELDRRVYGTGIFTESLRRFVLQHSHTKVRVLVNSTQLAIANSPRLVEFGRSMTSFVEFRELLSNRQQVVREEVLITDGRALLHREAPQDLESKFYGASPGTARLKLKGFDLLWDESVPAQELRKLSL